VRVNIGKCGMRAIAVRARLRGSRRPPPADPPPYPPRPLWECGHRETERIRKEPLSAISRSPVPGWTAIPDGGLVRAVAALGFPQVDGTLATQVIARATGARLHERDTGHADC
jgi:hypothetical protein